MSLSVKIGTYDLTAGQRGVTVSGMEAARAVQASRAIRAAGLKMLDRTTRQTSVGIRITREHADILAAQQFVLSHPDEALAASGEVEIRAQGTDGQFQRYKLADARLSSVRLDRLTGVTTTHSYTLTGGKIEILTA